MCTRKKRLYTTKTVLGTEYRRIIVVDLRPGA
jgi:hypothetical protein